MDHGRAAEGEGGGGTVTCSEAVNACGARQTSTFRSALFFTRVVGAHCTHHRLLEGTVEYDKCSELVDCLGVGFLSLVTAVCT